VAERDAVQGVAQSLKSVDDKVKTAAKGEERERARAEEFRDLFDKRGSAIARLQTVRNALGGELWIEKWDGKDNRVTIRGWHDDIEALIARSTTAGSTAAQIIEASLKGSNSKLVDTSAVKIESMTSVGKDALLDQIVVVVPFGGAGAKKGEKRAKGGSK